MVDVVLVILVNVLASWDIPNIDIKCLSDTYATN